MRMRMHTHTHTQTEHQKMSEHTALVLKPGAHDGSDMLTTRIAHHGTSLPRTNTQVPLGSPAQGRRAHWLLAAESSLHN